MASSYETLDPFAEDPDSTDYTETLTKLGWTNILTVGDSERSPLYVNAWQRQHPDGRTEYAVDVWDQNMGSPFVKVGSFPEVMDLLARWAPAVQAAAVSQLIAEVSDGGLSEWGTVEQMAARVAYGISDALPKMRAAEAEADRARRKRALAQRQAKQAGAVE